MSSLLPLYPVGVLMGVIALTSMPSITPKMNWREWRLLQSHAGWLAVMAATVSTTVRVASLQCSHGGVAVRSAASKCQLLP